MHMQPPHEGCAECVRELRMSSSEFIRWRARTPSATLHPQSDVSFGWSLFLRCLALSSARGSSPFELGPKNGAQPFSGLRPDLFSSLHVQPIASAREPATHRPAMRFSYIEAQNSSFPYADALRRLSPSMHVRSRRHGSSIEVEFG
jgi:hypothetical protein